MSRINSQIATEALVMQMAIFSILNKEGGREFKKLIKRLTDGDEG